MLSSPIPAPTSSFAPPSRPRLLPAPDPQTDTTSSFAPPSYPWLAVPLVHDVLDRLVERIGVECRLPDELLLRRVPHNETPAPVARNRAADPAAGGLRHLRPNLGGGERPDCGRCRALAWDRPTFAELRPKFDRLRSGALARPPAPFNDPTAWSLSDAESRFPEQLRDNFGASHSVAKARCCDRNMCLNRRNSEGAQLPRRRPWFRRSGGGRDAASQCVDGMAWRGASQNMCLFSRAAPARLPRGSLVPSSRAEMLKAHVPSMGRGCAVQAYFKDAKR